jgi:hypothetical protein
LTHEDWPRTRSDNQSALMSNTDANGEMKGVSRAKIELRLSGLAGRGAKVVAGDRENIRAFRGKPGERGKRAAQCSPP